MISCVLFSSRNVFIIRSFNLSNFCYFVFWGHSIWLSWSWNLILIKISSNNENVLTEIRSSHQRCSIEKVSVKNLYVIYDSFGFCISFTFRSNTNRKFPRNCRTLIYTIKLIFPSQTTQYFQKFLDLQTRTLTFVACTLKLKVRVKWAHANGWCHIPFLKSEDRRIYKAILFIKKTSDSKTQTWKLWVCRLRVCELRAQ